MAISSSNKQADSSQFSLKHRLIGAGLLISFGVLILPWMLGSYSVEHDQASQEKEEVKREAKPSSIASLVSNTGNKTVAQQRLGDSEKKPGSETEKTAEAKSEVKVFKSRVQPIEPITKEQTKIEKKPATNQAKQPVVNKSANEKQKVVKKTVADTPKKPANKQTTEKKSVPPKPGSTTISRGYIVSVGVFGDAKNVEKMVADLKSKQFAPEVKIETLNEKSVSRIFMGPYSTRAEAVKMKARLSEKKISKTLIKTFP